MNSMSFIPLALLLGSLLYGVRISGLLLAESPLPAALLRALRFAPMALLAALLAPGLAQRATTPELSWQLLPLLCAALLSRWSKRIDVGLFGGLALYGLIVALSGA